MFIEKKRKGVSPRLFTSNGTANGLVTVADGRDFFVKQRVQIKSNTKPTTELEIKRFVSNNSFRVGPIGQNIKTYEDVSSFLVTDGAVISADEQDRPGITDKDYNRAVYVEEPVVAKRTILVDEYGNYYTSNNPVPISGTIIVSSDSSNGQKIQNIPIANANTEYVISLPDDTKRYQIRVRKDEAKGKLALALGETLTNYWTINRGTVIDSYFLNLPIGSKLYVSLDRPNMVLEMLIWVKV